jgi:carbonic anhydrase
LTAGQGQHPLAAILACSDSRVPVELICDQGLGDLFVVRVAGNVAAADELGSLEYAVDHLNIPLLVVLGHSQCGAVSAVLDNAKASGNLAGLLAPIKPAVTRAREENPGASAEVLLDAAIKDNVWQALEDILQKSPVIRAAVKGGKVKLVGAVYELDTGKVQWLGSPPGLEKLLGGKANEGPKPPGRGGKKSKARAE